jgi:hypothetical protein
MCCACVALCNARRTFANALNVSSYGTLQVFFVYNIIVTSKNQLLFVVVKNFDQIFEEFVYMDPRY